jgi:plastocyanin
MLTNPVRLVAAVAVIAGVAACGGSSSSSATSSSAGTSAPSATSSSAITTSSSPPASGSGSTAKSSSAPAAASAGPVSLAADPTGQLKFSKPSLSAKAGKVTISFTNQAPEAHNLTIQQGTSGPTVARTPTFKGATKTLVVDLKPGTYTYYCSVPGHRMGGMQGTLTVN